MRWLWAALALIGAVLAETCLATEIDGAGQRQAPVLSFHANPADPAYGSVDLVLGAEAILRLRQSDPSATQLQEALPVLVDDIAGPASGTLPPVAGHYEILPDRVRFTLRFPPVKGLTYRADAYLSELSAGLWDDTHLTLSFSVPREPSGPPARVDQVFPSNDVLPENLLRFYIHFSEPMQRGWVEDHIFLFGPDGRPVEGAFFNQAIELWDPAMQRLTLLLDPGRIKRGVGPNIRLGTSLRQGFRYTLMIDRAMRDAAGRPLAERFTKSFTVVPAVRAPIDPFQWMMELPAPGTRQPLVLSLPTALDHALLARLIGVAKSDQQPITGRIEIDRHETRWTFTPASTWADGTYQLQIDAGLEDVSGNTPTAPFDSEDLGGAVEVIAGYRITLPFVLRPDDRTQWRH